MRFSAYVLFLVSISLPLYMVGYTNVVNEFLSPKQITSTGTEFTLGNQTLSISCSSGDPYCQNTPSSSNISIMWLLFAILLGAGVLAALLGGFSAMYIIPALIIIAIVNLVVMPYSFLFDPSIPESVFNFLFIPLIAIFNIITVLAVIDFVRGGA